MTQIKNKIIYIGIKCMLDSTNIYNFIFTFNLPTLVHQSHFYTIGNCDIVGFFSRYSRTNFEYIQKNKNKSNLVTKTVKMLRC